MLLQLPTPEHRSGVSTISVLRTDKSAQRVATATVRLQLHCAASYEQVLEVGLRALGEARASLFGYGIRDEAGEPIEPDVQRTSAHAESAVTHPSTSLIDAGVVVVWAHRD